jgi:hypothetical protein
MATAEGDVTVGARQMNPEHVFPDFAQTGLDGSYDSQYVNPWKWALESVGDDERRGMQLQMAPL